MHYYIPQFVARFWTAFCNLISTSVSLTSGHHPEMNGQTERINQELETVLRFLCAHHPSTWSKMLLWVEFAHNTLPCSSTGLSPFQCVHGYQHPLFPAFEHEVGVPSSLALVHKCCRSWTQARQLLLKNSIQYKKAADRRRQPAPEYRAGQKV